MKRKILIPLAVVLVLALLVGFNIKKSRERATEVEVESVARLDLTEVVKASGTIQPKISVDISSDVTGKIVEVGAEEGDRVSKGDLLLSIDPTQFREAVRSAEAQHEVSKASLSEARAFASQMELEWQRIKELHATRGISDRELESSRAGWHKARALIQSAEARLQQSSALLAQARDRLSKTEIRAPMNGVVVRRNAEPGEVAMEGTFSIQVLMVIADLSVMEVEVDVDETEIPLTGLGQSAAVEIDAFPDSSFSGLVTEIANSPRAGMGGDQGVDFKVVITLDRGYAGLRPGLSATAEITTARRDSALAIPIQALTIRSRKKLDKDESLYGPRLAKKGIELPAIELDADVKEVEGAFVIEEGRAFFAALTTGIAGEKHFEVISGLGSDQQIVTGPMRTLRQLHHGEKVKISRKKEEKGKKNSSGITVEIN